MLASSWPIRTIRLLLPRECSRATRGSLVLLLAGLLASAGCESAEKIDPTQPLPENLSAAELFKTTKQSWEACLADFYRDDWSRVTDQVQRLSELVNRWKAEKPPEQVATQFTANVAAMEQNVAQLRSAAESRDVPAATEALRQLGKRIAVFEAMR